MGERQGGLSKSFSRPVALCLSGGGFRATLFHLGVVDFLAQANYLHFIESVYGVSGGAVLAAHLAHHWLGYADLNSFADTCFPLISLCHRGIIDKAFWGNVFSNRTRTTCLAEELAALYACEIPTVARSTYIVNSSLTDTSQFAVELKGAELLQLNALRTSASALGSTGISSADAVSMSACFPIVFEPKPLTVGFTGLDMKTLKREHIVADGGIVDNLGLMFARLNAARLGVEPLFIVSDAGQIFDDLDPKEATVAASLSPMRAVDYLMNQTSQATVSNLEQRSLDESVQPSRLLMVRLSEARSYVDRAVKPGLLRSALRIRTNFDGFSQGEIVTLYRLGILAAKSSLDNLFGATSINPNGLVSDRNLGHYPLNIPWQSVDIRTKSGPFGGVIDLILRRPGIALLFATTITFFAAAGAGFAVRALVY